MHDSTSHVAPSSPSPPSFVCKLFARETGLAYPGVRAMVLLYAELESPGWSSGLANMEGPPVPFLIPRAGARLAPISLLNLLPGPRSVEKRRD